MSVKRWKVGISTAVCALALSQATLGHAQVEQAKLTASDADAIDWLGYTASIDGDTAVLGAFRDDDQGPSSGSAYVYVRSAAGWTEEAKLLASDGSSSDWFGYDAAISGDTIVVGAPEDNHGLELAAGSAYVFVRNGTSWSEQAKLVAPDRRAGDEFGATVAIAGDTIAIAALRDDTVGGTNTGSVYVFVRSGTTWSQQAKLLASDGASEDLFSLCRLSQDGNTLVVGSIRDDTPAGADAGSAYVFVRSGTSWSQQAKLTASDGAPGDQFGLWAAISGDTLLIGAFLADHAAGVDAGAAYVFVRSGTAWSEQAKLTASDGAAGDHFGVGVALEGDRAVIGAWLADLPAGLDAGAAYLFERSGTTWSEQAKLTASDAAADDQFGVSVALSGDRVLVGAHKSDHAGVTSAGAGYVYCMNPATVGSYNGDGLNADVLNAGPMIAGGSWTPSVAIGHAHGTHGALMLIVRSSTFNGPSLWMPPAVAYHPLLPRGPGGPGPARRLTEVLVTGPLLAMVAGTHDGVTGTFPSMAIPASLCMAPWAAQALVAGGGYVDLSSAVSGVVGQ